MTPVGRTMPRSILALLAAALATTAHPQTRKLGEDHSWSSAVWTTAHLLQANEHNLGSQQVQMLNNSLHSLHRQGVPARNIRVACFPEQACNQVKAIGLDVRQQTFTPAISSRWVAVIEEIKLTLLASLPEGQQVIWFETDMLFTCWGPGERIFAGVPENVDMAMTYRNPRPPNTGLMFLKNTPAVRELHRANALALASGPSEGGENQKLLTKQGFDQIAYGTSRVMGNLRVYSLKLSLYIFESFYKIPKQKRLCKVLRMLAAPKCVLHFNGPKEVKALMLEVAKHMDATEQHSAIIRSSVSRSCHLHD